MTDLEKRINEWSLSPAGQREITATAERAKRVIRFVEDEIRIDPDVWNQPTTI